MLKIKSEKAVLWGSSNQRVLDQVNWDQNFWALFDDYLTLFHYIWNQKSLDAPITYSDLPNRYIVELNETMTKFARNAKRDNPINRDDGKHRKLRLLRRCWNLTETTVFACSVPITITGNKCIVSQTLKVWKRSAFS